MSSSWSSPEPEPEPEPLSSTLSGAMLWHQQLARDFVQSITQKTTEPIEGSEDGMLVLRDAVMLETGKRSDVVIRRVTGPFWQACIDAVERKGRRVCAFGNAGIGKTACTPYLIKMLLEANKAVVYHVRTHSKDGWLYEFVPELSDGTGGASVVATRAHPERTPLSDIALLNDPETYYVVDPGDTTDSCNPPSRLPGQGDDCSGPSLRQALGRRRVLPATRGGRCAGRAQGVSAVGAQRASASPASPWSHNVGYRRGDAVQSGGRRPSARL
jgi:hypothetical protein